MKTIKASIIGLDMTQNVIQVIALKKTQKGYALAGFASMNTPPDSIKKGFIIAPDKIARALKQLWARNKIKCKRVSLALHGEGILLRTITIPFVKEEGIQSVLENRAKQYLAFAGANMVVAWEKLGETVEAGEKKLKVLLAASKRSLVDSYLAALKKAGLFVSGITLPSLAATRALLDGSLKSRASESRILVAIDYNQTFIHLFQGGIISFTHILNYGARDFLSAPDTFDRLVETLNRILASKAEAVKIIFSLSSAKLKDMVKKAEERLAKSVEIGWGTLKPAPELEEAVVALGLARSEPLKINLLPSEVKSAEEWRMHISYFLYSLSGLSLSMLALFFALYLSSYVIESQIAAVKGELSRPTIIFSRLKEVENKTDEVNDLVAGRRQIIQRSPGFYWGEIFQELPTLLPVNIRLTRMEIKEAVVMLGGEARSSDAVFDFMQRLKTSKNLSNVDLQIVKEEEGGLVSFSIYTEKQTDEK
jgi:type IV pilus assembly protein PilM